MKRIWFLICLAILTTNTMPLLAQTSAKIRGLVIDKQTETPLPGANISLKGTSFGTATDLDGVFFISKIPPGNYQMVVQYIGYGEKKFDITLEEGETISKTIELQYQSIEGEEVEVTAQAEGQMQAINQQITSSTIKNVVSAAKIQELPESNAAEAVGRLPGVSLKREGGEGNKVVIRGLSPKYNNIQIDGVSMTATDTSNRSVDLSMISPSMLEGIEVSKTAMADQEANRLGGSVNFKLRNAPQKTTLNLTVQRGYSGLREEIGNYQYIASGSKRFFNNRFGVFLQGNLESVDRSDNNVFAGYQMLHDTVTIANSLGFQDISRVNERKNGVLVMDYNTQNTKIKLSNMYSNIDVESYQRQEFLDAATRSHNYNGIFSERNMTVMVNSLRLDQYIGDVLMTGSINYSRSKTDVPEELRIEASESNGFQRNWTFDDGPLNPAEFTKKAVNDTSNIDLTWFRQKEFETLEEEVSGDLNFEWGRDLGIADFKFKFGGKYKHKNRDFDKEENRVPLGWNDLDLVRTFLADEFNLQNFDVAQDFPYRPFIDNNYDTGNFLAGDFSINRVPDIEKFIEIFHEIENLKTVRGEKVGKTVYRDYNASIQGDYFGDEDYFAAYLMPTFQFGESFTFIPGFRYESNSTDYTGHRANSPGKWSDPFPVDTVSATRENDFLLPMIHAKYKPNTWFDIRASYTQTLSRPDYRRIIPSWTAWQDNLTWNNTSLVPAESKNFDIFLSFYGNKLGLFTVGGFQKSIKNFIFNTTTWIADSSFLRPEWPESVQKGGKVFGYINNPNEADLFGFETEWQSNFWFLPGVLKGLVVSVNYTYTHSELKYPRQEAVWDTIQIGPIQVPKLAGMRDASYEARLLDQPTHTLNMTVGFDYRGLSLRSSLQYRSDVFAANHWFEQLRETTDPLTLYDMKIRQKLPFQGLQMFLNINNFSRAIEQTTNNGTDWFTNKSFYGLNVDLGLKYEL